MKRFFVLLLVAVALFSALPVLAQDNPDVITLNDATPAIDVVVTLSPDTTGTIALDFSGAGVSLDDSNGTVVFHAGDVHLHGLELNMAPNSGSHTLTVSRLPGLVEASVRVRSLPELTQNGTPTLVSGLALTVNQEVLVPLTTDHLGDTVAVSIPTDSVGALTATFPGANATTQVVDAAGVVIAESTGGQVDGMTLVLDAGEYQFVLLSSALSTPVIAGMSAVSAADAGFTVLPAPESAAPAPVVANTTACAAVMTVSSATLRSGPGTGYSILGYGYRDQTFRVGGRNPGDNWLVVQTDTGSAWVARPNIQTQGDCANLAVFNIPLRDAQPAPLVITTPAPSGTYNDDDGQEQRESGENGEREGDD